VPERLWGVVVTVAVVLEHLTDDRLVLVSDSLSEQV
jgi:hypothetical protein